MVFLAFVYRAICIHDHTVLTTASQALPEPHIICPSLVIIVVNICNEIMYNKKLGSKNDPK